MIWPFGLVRLQVGVNSGSQVALAGVAPGLVLHIDGGSAFYFSDVQRWLSVGLLIAGAGSLVRLRLRNERVEIPASRSFSGLRTSRVAFTLAAIPFALTILLNATYWPVRMVRANVETRRAIYGESAAGIPGGMRSLPQLVDARILESGLLRSRNHRVVEELRRLGTLPAAEKRRTALFIPQSERRYWDLLARPGACTFAGHVAPALTGLVMIDGMPSVGCPLSQYYGIAHFRRRIRPQESGDMTAGALCRRAGATGIDRVLMVTFDASGRMGRRLIDCASSPVT